MLIGAGIMGGVGRIGNGGLRMRGIFGERCG